MLCKIADLLIEVPEAGGMDSRCRDYLYDGTGKPDIVIDEGRYNHPVWPGASYEATCYMDSGTQFFGNLLRFDGMLLHASAVELDGKAYLFSGSSGMGKSTHTGLWQQIFGEKARVFNDDKPALRCLDGTWYAYGAPWCGKDGININMKVPVAGICFLQQAQENRIRRLNSSEAMQRILAQTMHRFKKLENLDLMLKQLDKLVRRIPVFELENRPEKTAALMSYEAMCRAAKENRL